MIGWVELYDEPPVKAYSHHGSIQSQRNPTPGVAPYNSKKSKSHESLDSPFPLLLLSDPPLAMQLFWVYFLVSSMVKEGFDEFVHVHVYI